MDHGDVSGRIAKMEERLRTLAEEVERLRDWRHDASNKIAPLILSFEANERELRRLTKLASELRGGWRAMTMTAVVASALTTAIWEVVTHFFQSAIFK